MAFEYLRRHKPKNTLEIGGGAMEQLIRSEEVETIKYIPKGQWLILKLKTTSTNSQRFAKVIEEFHEKGKIEKPEDFRVSIKIVSLEYMQQQISDIISTNNLELLEIQVEQ